MTTRIYDLPTRMFHWLFAGSFLTAFTIANTIDDESTAFAWHMLAGLIMVFTVLLRIVWGFVGTKHARFSDFHLNPAALFQYINGVFTGNNIPRAGHNPASSWAAMLMMLLAIGLGVSGYLMASGSAGDVLEDAHELMADLFIGVVILHLAGLVLHNLKHQDQLSKSMLSGDKQGLDQSTQSVRSHRLLGLLFVCLTLSFGMYLQQNFAPATGTLHLLGTTLQLSEAGEHSSNKNASEENDDD
ncbi:cytochrome b/b6 domain-containing protein [Rheinheimera sp.]|uniref:cytochrome b/b6 domain-containing protein n=1 Tax=Rheinheimera sp. TaxID=1869214 RepID=UPI003D282500